MATSTIFTGFNQPVEDRSLILIINDIKAGKYKQEVDNIRSCIASGDYPKADQLKKQLPAFTPSGTYAGGRKAHLLQQYSGFVHLDFDKLPPQTLEEAFTSISQIPFTFSCLRSPSGNGLKVFVEVNTSELNHHIAYHQVQEYYENSLGIPCDPKCKDITRLCFVSYDPHLFKNLNSEKFLVQLPDSITQPSPAPLPKPPPPPTPSIPPAETQDLNALFIFEQQVQFTNQKLNYADGNRNNYMYLLSSNCNRAGLPEMDTLFLCTRQFDLPEMEIKAAVRSAYTNHSAEFAKFANSANSAKLQTPSPSQSSEIDQDFLRDTPTIPNQLILNLPVLMQSGANAFTDTRERDVFLTGAFAILSGCMPKVQGIYAQQIVYPNLFAFILAPAASGKGALKFSKMLADKRHDLLLKASREEQQHFQAELNQYKASQKSRKKGDPPEEPPVPPPFKVVFIPANSSYAKILTHLQDNQGEGIICETEADTMGNVLKQEWGGYSDMLRKAFHHERLSSSKKTNNEYIEVGEPRLSVALSGTPNQVTGLIASAEDGLFSRFVYYAFKTDQLWRDVSPFASNINLTDHFKALSHDAYEMYLFLELYPTFVQLSRAQWEHLNQNCSHWLAEVITFTGSEAGSVVKRLGLILYRICMILTSLRKFQNGDTSSTVVCSDTDFDTALQLANLYLQHSVLMFHNLPRQSETSEFKGGNNKRNFFQALPSSFKRADAIQLGKTYNLSVRSVDALLKELNGHYLTQPQFGCYVKT
jgi:hypothetical protein